MSLSEADAKREVRAWGFPRVYTWTDRANAHYAPHTHPGITTHLILSGTFTVTYPDKPDAQKETFGPGARIDVPAGQLHEVWIGEEGCTYVIGE
ncbi:hypothetical protein GLOTRDRAFT_33434 [Gloeophyllum trabeum ATCC 11539]|uniref:Cupin 2 conserved barrel domain-containing protein n=1 Tax=Gloeophyllum trabeum (strain ATCC 11539 / FP-39264 / Madison 617) TaxID=670483 RepID=S7QG58_GLOTA|nr:uncharacterized protein GLOTRDRAFT_33434 [Gloeophyllum trabeum ATCC 11539]EPQ58866.1 hypothetical protein GLOTRDRAFT_33434 [Gloeophyllum trabeum ATCC 11539]